MFGSSVSPDEFRKLVHMAAEEDVTEFDEIAGTLNKESIWKVRIRADAVVLAKQVGGNSSSQDDPSRQWIENMADAILKRRVALQEEHDHEEVAKRTPRL